MELLGAEAPLDDGGQPRPRTLGPAQAGDDAGAELGEEVAHRREDEVVLGAEVVVRERRGDAGARGDLRDRDVERATRGNLLQRRPDQGAAPGFGHAGAGGHRATSNC